MKTCAYILRGFLYMENWKPLSNSGKNYCYTQDIKEYWVYHKKLIKILLKEFKVTIYFITYDITPPEYIEWAKEKGNVIFFRYNDSSQFRTLFKGFRKIENYDFYMIHRTDVKYHDDFYNLFKKIKIPQEITVLNKEYCENTNDIFFWIPHKKKLEFQNAISSFTTHAHNINKKTIIEYLSNTTILKIRCKNNLFELQGTNQSNIVVYSVPKSGTHYLSNIITLLIKQDVNIYNKEEMYKYVPHITKKQNIDFFSTHPMHISYNELNYNHKCIMMIRNPIDLAISKYFYFEKRKLRTQQRPIYKYINDTIENVIIEVNTMKELHENNKHNSILLRYEDLYLKFDEMIPKIVEFINIYMPNVIKNVNIDKIKETVSFKKVQNKEKQNGIYKVGRIQNGLFHRSGKINQIKEHLNFTQINNILNKIPNSMFELFPEMNILKNNPNQKRKNKPKRKPTKGHNIGQMIWFK